MAAASERSAHSLGRAPRPRVAVTMGDPAGVGPEVVLKAAASSDVRRECDVVVVGSLAALEWWSRRLELPLPPEVVDVGDVAPEPGRSDEDGARSAIEAVTVAARLCQAGEADAMATAPVSKLAIARAGYEFRGHTEFLAELTGASDVVMTFVSGARRVGLATTHLPLSEVARVLTTSLVRSKLVTLARGLADWLGVDDPRIAVAALNPHAGEGGRLGDEEERIIGPAIAEAREAGVRADGPFPADAVYRGLGEAGSDGLGASFDAVLAMYHDQATIPVKLWGFGRAVNLTLGLPIVRTSVDHGTAYDLAGAGRADAGSMEAAVRLAGEIVRRRLFRLEVGRGRSGDAS